jgi:hypothetical protein
MRAFHVVHVGSHAFVPPTHAQLGAPVQLAG